VDAERDRPGSQASKHGQGTLSTKHGETVLEVSEPLSPDHVAAKADGRAIQTEGMRSWNTNTDNINGILISVQEQLLLRIFHHPVQSFSEIHTRHGTATKDGPCVGLDFVKFQALDSSTTCRCCGHCSSYLLHLDIGHAAIDISLVGKDE
jgi:hypothetical protein